MNHIKKRHNPSASSSKLAKHAKANHQVRIIGGDWKRTPLTVVDGEGLRPTPDRVRETLFNWLNHVWNGQWQQLSCLDVFAGSGALGFEAASRGAKKVTMFEAFPAAFAQLQQVKEKLKADQIHLQRGDALVLLKSLIAKEDKFEVIFLDPPFNLGFLEKVLPLCADLLAPQGVLYVESERAFTNLATTQAKNWQVVREEKAGSVHFHLLQRNTDSGEAA